jgi:2-oxoglutarate ferredoxin oxidoreductase subunit beta
MEKLIMDGVTHRGFSMIEVMSNCHTYFGRLNRQGDAVRMMKWFKDKSVSTTKAKNMEPDELKDKWLIGKLHEDNEKTEFCDEYQKVVDAHLGGR